jgi:hypothetical protein
VTRHFHIRDADSTGPPVADAAEAYAAVHARIGKLVTDDVNTGQAVTVSLDGGFYVIRSAGEYLNGEQWLALDECDADHEVQDTARAGGAR